MRSLTGWPEPAGFGFVRGRIVASPTTRPVDAAIRTMTRVFILSKHRDSAFNVGRLVVFRGNHFKKLEPRINQGGQGEGQLALRRFD